MDFDDNELEDLLLYFIWKYSLKLVKEGGFWDNLKDWSGDVLKEWFADGFVELLWLNTPMEELDSSLVSGTGNTGGLPWWGADWGMD